MNQDLKHPELSIGTNLVIQHIEELKEENQLSRENLEEKVEKNPRLNLEDLDEILEILNFTNWNKKYTIGE